MKSLCTTYCHVYAFKSNKSNKSWGSELVASNMILCGLDNINLAAHSEISQIDGIAFGKHLVLHSPWSPPPTLRVSEFAQFSSVMAGPVLPPLPIGSPVVFSLLFFSARFLLVLVGYDILCTSGFSETMRLQLCLLGMKLLREPGPLLALGFLDRCMVTNNLALKVFHLILGFGIRMTLKRTHYRCTRQFGVIVIRCKRQAHLP